MKKTVFPFILLFLLQAAWSQNVAVVNLTGDFKIEPGSSNRVTINVKNTQNAAIVKYQSDYTVVLIYKGSTNAGQSINKSVSLGQPLGPGASRDFDISFTGPILPGEYDVEAYLKWGNKIVSNIDKATFIVAANYEVSITAKTTSFYVERGGTRDIDIRFQVTNSGNTAWPEGKYSLHFDVVSTPSGANRYDKEAFSISPKAIELWSFDPGDGDEYVYQDFKPPFTEGSYTVRVTLMLNGKAFDADGNPKNLTFKIDVK